MVTLPSLVDKELELVNIIANLVKFKEDDYFETNLTYMEQLLDTFAPIWHEVHAICILLVHNPGLFTTNEYAEQRTALQTVIASITEKEAAEEYISTRHNGKISDDLLSRWHTTSSAGREITGNIIALGQMLEAGPPRFNPASPAPVPAPPTNSAFSPPLRPLADLPGDCTPQFVLPAAESIIKIATVVLRNLLNDLNVNRPCDPLERWSTSLNGIDYYLTHLIVLHVPTGEHRLHPIRSDPTQTDLRRESKPPTTRMCAITVNVDGTIKAVYEITPQIRVAVRTYRNLDSAKGIGGPVDCPVEGTYDALLECDIARGLDSDPYYTRLGFDHPVSNLDESARCWTKTSQYTVTPSAALAHASDFELIHILTNTHINIRIDSHAARLASGHQPVDGSNPVTMIVKTYEDDVGTYRITVPSPRAVVHRIDDDQCIIEVHTDQTDAEKDRRLYMTEGTLILFEWGNPRSVIRIDHSFFEPSDNDTAFRTSLAKTIGDSHLLHYTRTKSTAISNVRLQIYVVGVDALPAIGSDDIIGVQLIPSLVDPQLLEIIQHAIRANEDAVTTDLGVPHLTDFEKAILLLRADALTWLDDP
jgi:hypothetical protein